MKEEQDYIRDIAEIRSMMERSTKFLSLAGWAGIMAGIYALTGAYIAVNVFSFNPDSVEYSTMQPGVIVLALTILILTVGTAIFLSYRKAAGRGEKIWNASAKHLVINMAVPLVAGGLLILVLITKGLIGLIAPVSLLFYGLAIFNAGKFTYEEMKTLGIIEMILGLISSYYVEYGILFWAIGFGVVHIVYGIYLHFKYEK